MSKRLLSWVLRARSLKRADDTVAGVCGLRVIAALGGATVAWPLVSRCSGSVC